MIFGPFDQTEVYANLGYGFHSNDARGATITNRPWYGRAGFAASRRSLARSPPRSASGAFPLPKWQTTVALWGLDIASELVFVGDAGTTEASRPSRRYGVEWSNYYRVLPWMTLDLDLSVSKARFRDDDPAGNLIPGAVQNVVVGGVSVDSLAELLRQPPRPLLRPAAARSKTTASARRPRRRSPRSWVTRSVRGLRAQVEVFNILDAQVSDIDYFYPSRLPGEPVAGVDDIHFHPTQPRSARLSVVYGF